MRGWVLGAGCALVCAGCFIVLEDDRAPRAGPGPEPLPPGAGPLGSAVSLSGEWGIDGSSATAASCAELGIASVAVGFFDDFGARVTFPQLTFACASGAFDTRPTAVLAAGRFTTQWVALDAGGRERFAGPMQLLDVTLVSHAVLARFDILGSELGFEPLGSDAELLATWTVDGAPADAASCGRLGIDAIGLVFYDEGDVDLTDGRVVGMAPCVAGRFDSMPMRILRYGSYRTAYRALDSSGFHVAESLLADLTIDSPLTRVEMAPVDFVSR